MLVLAGCEGALSADRPPSVMLDDAGHPPGTDAGMLPVGGHDGGAPAGSDAGTPLGTDAGMQADPCGGLTLQGRCDATTARWCEAGAMREEACGARGCALVEGLYRCNAEPPIPTECASPIEARQLELTNAARREMGLGPLRCDPGLALAARLHSQDMCDQSYFEHDSLDGRSFIDRINEQRVAWRTAGENIAWGQRSPEEVHEAWMGSSGHRANILNGAFGRIGIGYVECSRGPYWTQDFAD